MFLVACVSVACSYVTVFAVCNRSDRVITVIYAYRPGGQKFEAGSESRIECPLPAAAPPALGDAPAIGWWRVEPPVFRELTPSEFTFDPTRCRIEVELQPGQALRLGGGFMYPATGDWGELANLELEIRSTQGAISYSEFELLHQFRRRSDSFYELQYD